MTLTCGLQHHAGGRVLPEEAALADVAPEDEQAFVPRLILDCAFADPGLGGAGGQPGTEGVAGELGGIESRRRRARFTTSATD